MADTMKARRVEPSMRITDPRFQYVPAANTDVSRTFAKVSPGWPHAVENNRCVQANARRVLAVSQEAVFA